MRTAIATKFVAWEVPTLEALKGSKVYNLREKLNNGGQMNREEKDWLTEKVNSNKIRGLGSTKFGEPARQQGVRTPHQTQQRRKVEPRGKGLAYTQREQQYLFQERSTLARLDV